MLDGHLFDTLAEIADCLRKKTTKPFGGIQVRQDQSSFSHLRPWNSLLLREIFSNFPPWLKTIHSLPSRVRHGNDA